MLLKCNKDITAYENDKWDEKFRRSWHICQSFAMQEWTRNWFSKIITNDAMSWYWETLCTSTLIYTYTSGQQPVQFLNRNELLVKNVSYSEYTSKIRRYSIQIGRNNNRRKFLGSLVWNNIACCCTYVSKVNTKRYL